MKRLSCFIVALMLIFVSAAAAFAQDPGWPRIRTEKGNKLVIYQPQVDNWNNFTELEWRMAVELTPKGGKPVVGVMVMKGETEVDNDSKMVLITNLQVVKTNFPSLDPAKAKQMEELTKQFLPPSVPISLQRLVASIPKKESAPGVQLRNDPPVIFFSYKPAIILDLDGQPLRAAIQDTKLEYVVNTRWPVFFDTRSDQFYLLAGEQWLTAPKLEGTWTVAKKLPEEMKAVAKDAQWSDLKKFVPLPAANAKAAAPKVFYSTSPAEVILFNGNPVYEQIPGTALQYATNTMSYVFFHAATKQYYYLSAGRWFSSGSLAGPWTFATPSLPADFARIPHSSPASQVLASVPGTEEAKDAVLMAQVPTTVTVDPAAAAAVVQVKYDGTPKFVPIESTTLYYATNTSEKVIRAGDLYYLCFQGVWFVSVSPQGPWQIAKSVPQVIYTIPPSSPVYNVTYVTQVTTSAGYVQASYTAGYMGVYVVGVTTGVIIAGGTGYYYPPYVAVYPGYRPIYYPMPYTYGYVAHYHSPTGVYGVSQTVYGRYGTATRAAAYNPYTGTYARGASVSTPYGTAAAARAYNPYTGSFAATRQGSNAYASWGSSVVSKGGKTAYTQHYSNARGTTGSIQTSTGGKAAGVSTKYGSTAVGKTGSGDVYAGHDGNVYKNTGDGWQKYDDGGWSNVQKPQHTQQEMQQKAQSRQPQAKTQQQTLQQRGSSFQQSGSSEQLQKIQQEAQGRQRGAQSSKRHQQFQQSGADGARSARGGSAVSDRTGGGGRGRR